jgi:hypothetical protein
MRKRSSRNTMKGSTRRCEACGTKTRFRYASLRNKKRSALYQQQATRLMATLWRLDETGNLVETLAQAVVAFCFNPHGTKVQDTTKAFYQCFLFQVLQHTEKIPSEIHVLEQWVNGKQATWSTSACEEFLGYIVPLLYQPIFCYIDALDECASSSARDTWPF